MLNLLSKRIHKLLFQSAPGREAGRCGDGLRYNDILFSGFNPRPAVRPGDAELARPKAAEWHGFNPRPAVRPGDASMHRRGYRR